jgi:tetratricopeptide (TPR) repeat protein
VLSAEARAELADRGGGVRVAMATATYAHVEFLAGDFAAAAALGEEACGLFDELGEKSFQSTTAGSLALGLYELDRLDEADKWAGRAADLGASDDVATQMLWRQARAKVLARRDEHVEAERLARQAIAAGEETDGLNAQGHAYADLAEVLFLAGRSRDAVEAHGQALARFERKGNVVMAERVRNRLAAVRERATI